MNALASNGVYLIPPETDDRMGFLTTNILTMFVLLALIVEMIPTPATKEDSPLVMAIYECSVGLFIIQYLVVIFTHQMATWKDEMKPWIQKMAGIKVDYTKPGFQNDAHYIHHLEMDMKASARKPI